MRGTWVSGLVIGALAISPTFGSAAEHGGQEHAGKEHGGQPASSPAPTEQSDLGGSASQTGTAGLQDQGEQFQTESAQVANVEPSAEQIRQAIRDYIHRTDQDEGAFTIDDDVTGTTRTLALVRVHDRVGKTGAFYYSCTDMRDTANDELLDLDFDVDAASGQLEVVDVRIHKVNGTPRYTYDDKDNRIPLM